MTSINIARYWLNSSHGPIRSTLKRSQSAAECTWSAISRFYDRLGWRPNILRRVGLAPKHFPSPSTRTARKKSLAKKDSLSLKGALVLLNIRRPDGSFQKTEKRLLLPTRIISASLNSREPTTCTSINSKILKESG